jgi:2-polyprenyl-6-methoxyphenol hydroxylase-like FAD-dependent oxidoreductase
MKAVDVCVVGGGPGGLALARALARAAPSVKVQVRAPPRMCPSFKPASGLMLHGGHAACPAMYPAAPASPGSLPTPSTWRAPSTPWQVFERAWGLRECGAGVAIHPNGTAALRAIDPQVCDTLFASSLASTTVAVENAEVRPGAAGAPGL